MDLEVYEMYDDYIQSPTTQNILSWTESSEAVRMKAAIPSCINVSGVPDPNQPSLTYKLIVDVYIAGILCLAGFLGNALSIVVLYHDREKQNTTNWLLQTLALMDTAYLAACVFIQPIKTINDFTDWIPSLKQVFPYMEPHIWGLGSIAQTATVWVVLLVTFDRFVAVCLPLRSQWRSIEKAKLSVGIIIFIACVYNIPRFLERKMYYTLDCRDNSSVIMTRRTTLRNSRVYFLVYKTICYFIFRAIGPLIALIYLNSRLIFALQMVRRRYKDLKKKAKHRENITAMLVVVVTVFIICTLPDLSIRIAFTISEFANIELNILALRYANSISNTLLAVNSSSNFLIYCLVGKKFRRILLQMLSCRKGRYSGIGEPTETELLAHTTGSAGCLASKKSPQNNHKMTNKSPLAPQKMIQAKIENGQI